MSLIKCPECGKEVSDKAKTCVNCGYPIEEYLSEINSKEEEKPTCLLCGSEIKGDEDYCLECGNRLTTYSLKTIKEVLNPGEPYSICPKCGSKNNKKNTVCINCNYVCSFAILKTHYLWEAEDFSTDYEFNGIYRYNFWGEKKEVYCPRCGSENCSHYKEQQFVPAKIKTRYTANLNPLRPFTVLNKKEKVVRQAQTVTNDKFMCNECGKIFD